MSVMQTASGLLCLVTSKPGAFHLMLELFSFLFSVLYPLSKQNNIMHLPSKNQRGEVVLQQTLLEIGVLKIHTKKKTL